MYLAEDRVGFPRLIAYTLKLNNIWQILCWELVSKRDSRWILHYVKSARAVTDVPNHVRLSPVIVVT